MPRAPYGDSQGAQVEVVGVQALGRLPLARSISACSKLGSMAPTTLCGDLVLKREDVVKCAVEPVRPKVRACRRLD